MMPVIVRALLMLLALAAWGAAPGYGQHKYGEHKHAPRFDDPEQWASVASRLG